MVVSIIKISAIARIILLDGLRRHALIGLLLLALTAEAGGMLFFDFIPRDIGRASVDFIFSISWIVGFIFIFFHAVQIISWDEERRVIHTLLARPIARGEYVIGVFFGLAALLFLLNFLLGIIGWATLMLIRQMVDPAYFSYFSHTFYFIGWMGLFAMELMMLSVIMLFSGLIRGGFPVLLVSLCFYLICSGLPVVRESVAQRILEAEGSIFSEKLLQTLTAFFPDFSRLDFKNAVMTAADQPVIYEMLTGFALFFAYTLLTLWIAGYVYRQRDLQ